MTDLDTLRRALQVPEDAGDPLDIRAIIGRGRRLRTRRRVAAVAGGLCAAAAVFGAVAGISRLLTPPTGPAEHPVSPGRSAPAPYHNHGGPGRVTTPVPVPTASPTMTNPAASPTFSAGGPSPTFPSGGPSASFTSGLPTPSPSASTEQSSIPASPASASMLPSPTG